jgi:curved DNA-binding protein CbpA
MDRTTAARLLGVPQDASGRRLRRAYRARVTSTHPDRFPPGSEAWEDANAALQRLNEAVRVLGAPPAAPGSGLEAGSGPSATSAAGASYDPVASWERSSEGFRSPRDSDRLARAWGYWWGGFLLASAVVCAVIGAQTPSNDALPIWSPALAVIGGVAVAIGWRADRRLRR